MKKIFSFLFLFLFIFLFGTVSVQALDMAVPISFENLDPIPVRIPTKANPYRDYPGKVTIISGEQIAHSGMQNISELLNAYGGMQVYSLMGNGLQTYINHRGFDAEGKSVVVMLDGVDISNSFDGTINLKMIPLDSIDKIEIFHGSASSLVGSDALGGLIAITTKASSAILKSQVQVQRGSYDYLQTGVFVSAPLSENLPGIQIAFNHEGWDGARTNGFYEKNNLFLKLDPKIDETSQFMVSLSLFKDDVGRLGNLTLSQFEVDPTQIGTSAVVGEHTYSQGDLVNFSYLKNFDGWQWRQQFFSHLNSIDSQASFATQIGDQKRGLVTEFTFNAQTSAIVLGYDFKQQNSTYQDNFGTSAYANQKNQALYFSQLHHLGSQWAVSYGLRYDDINWDFQQTGWTNIPLTHRKAARLSPKMGLTYQASDVQEIYFNYSEAFKAPRPNTFFNVGGGTYFPNVDIEPQTAFTYETGTRFHFENLSLEGGVYSSVVNKEILYDNITATNKNFDSLHQGFEGALRYALSADQNISWISHYNRSRFVGGAYQGKVLPLAPEWRHSMVYDQTLFSHWTQVWSAHSVSGLYDLNDFQNIFSQKSFAYLDYQLSFRPTASEEYFLKVQNLTNEKYNAYPVSNGTTVEKVNPSLPRTLVMGIKASF